MWYVTYVNCYNSSSPLHPLPQHIPPPPPVLSYLPSHAIGIIVCCASRCESSPVSSLFFLASLHFLTCSVCFRLFLHPYAGTCRTDITQLLVVIAPLFLHSLTVRVPAPPWCYFLHVLVYSSHLLYSVAINLKSLNALSST